MADWDGWLESWSNRSRASFAESHQIKSFQEYLGDLAAHPYELTRNALQYVVDMMEGFGTEKSSWIGEEVTRFKLFDAPFGCAADQPLMGQELPVLAIYEAMKNLVLEGRSDRMFHLHGPSGSAKSLIVELLMRGCEEYSRRPEGAIFSFNWVFPREDEARTLGFMGGDEAARPGGEAAADSFAHWPSDRLEARIPCDLGDSPILLLPPGDRLALIGSLLDKAPHAKFVASQFLEDGNLCPRCKQIFDALMVEYSGDVLAVLRHVQVRRRYLSRRYRRGAVVISPQDTPDASSRQLTLDSSLSTLPTTLQHLNLIQLSGDLIDANNGLVEFSDFLTRAPELNKYLLAATERSELALSTANVYLNEILFATSNERHLDAFKQSADFASFKGRMILVTVPYLLERKKETAIYRPILTRIGRTKHVAPHVAELAALWAVLSRLNRPEPDHYPEESRTLIRGLTPYEKGLLYDGVLPTQVGRYPAKQLRLLREILPDLRDEFRDTPIYEGRFGASPREMREILYGAVYRRPDGCLTPALLFEEIAEFVKDKSLYLFLQLKADEGYHDAEAAVAAAQGEYFRTLDQEVLAAMELVPEGQYTALFDRYFRHVRAFLRGEKVRSAPTGQWEEPNEALMEQVEEYLAIGGSAPRFREDLMGQVAAWTLENPGEALDLSILFAPQIESLSKGFHARVKHQVQEIGQALTSYGTPAFAGLPPARQEAAKNLLEQLAKRFGYCPRCAPEAVAYLMAHLYEKA